MIYTNLVKDNGCKHNTAKSQLTSCHLASLILQKCWCQVTWRELTFCWTMEASNEQTDGRGPLCNTTINSHVSFKSPQTQSVWHLPLRKFVFWVAVQWAPWPRHRTIVQSITFKLCLFSNGKDLSGNPGFSAHIWYGQFMKVAESHPYRVRQLGDTNRIN